MCLTKDIILKGNLVIIMGPILAIDNHFSKIVKQNDEMHLNYCQINNLYFKRFIVFNISPCYLSIYLTANNFTYRETKKNVNEKISSKNCVFSFVYIEIFSHTYSKINTFECKQFLLFSLVFWLSRHKRYCLFSFYQLIIILSSFHSLSPHLIFVPVFIQHVVKTKIIPFYKFYVDWLKF